MPYTLAKFFWWALVAAAIGVVVGWLLRSIRCARDIRRAEAVAAARAEQDAEARIAEVEADAEDRIARAAWDAERAVAASVGAGAGARAAGGGMLGFAGLAASLGAPDLDRAKEVLGRAVALDDLKIVEGIGPKLASVLQEAGVTTWAALADTAPDRIRAVLLAADERHRIHDPETWPRQARLAAIGEWEALKAWQDQLTSGRG